MKVFQNHFYLLLITVVLSGASGCQEAIEQAGNAAQSDQTSESLKMMGSAFHNYHDVHQQFPGDWDDLIAFETERGQHAEVYEQLRDDGCVVNGWGLRMRDIVVGSSNFALAYMPDAEQSGGSVLHADGTVFQISTADLQAAIEKQKDIKPRG